MKGTKLHRLKPEEYEHFDFFSFELHRLKPEKIEHFEIHNDSFFLRLSLLVYRKNLQQR